MATGTQRQGHTNADNAGSPMWRRMAWPAAWPAVTTAAIAVLFTPLPAAAAPRLPAEPIPAAVPDTGSRPMPLGSLRLPGQGTPTPSATGVPASVATTPLVTEIDRRRAEFALLGDRLLGLREELTMAREQVTVATAEHQRARQAVLAAEQEAGTVATAALKTAAALPPGTIGSDLYGLGGLARIQRGEAAGEESAGRRLALARDAEMAADSEVRTATARATDLSEQHDDLLAQHRRKQTALTELETRHAAELAEAEAAEAGRDRELGAGYTGSIHGKGADPRALAALAYAKAQIGDDYVWSTEGPDTFDCSGLTWAAYHHRGGHGLPRVSRDQYWATRGKSVDRYSLLPGDLLFFSSSDSWTDIHHVAMYAGDGMMVEAPRSNLQVRLVPVRWTRLFQATRVHGAVDAPTPPPPPAQPTPTATPDRTPKPSPKPSAKPAATSKPAGTPSATTKPTTTPTPTPTSAPSPSSPPSSSPPSPPSPPSPSPSSGQSDDGPSVDSNAKAGAPSRTNPANTGTPSARSSRESSER